MKFVSTVVCLLAVSSSPIAGADSMLRGIPGMSPSSDAIASQEDGIFSGYLKNAGKSGVETASELARLRATRSMRAGRAYRRQWWLSCAEAQRQAEERAYFDQYYLGVQTAQAVIGDILNDKSCASVRSLKSPSSDPVLEDAFARGVEAAYPVCFASPDFTAVQALGTRLDSIERDLFEIQKRVAAYRPNAIEQDTLARALLAQLTSVITAQIEQTRLGLVSALDLDPAILARIDQTVSQISSAIGCPTLKSRQGEAFACNIQVLPAAYPLTQADAVRVIYQKQDIGPFQKRIEASSFFRAVNTYLTEVRPTDSIVRFMVSNLQAELSQLDQRLGEEVSDLLADHQRLTDEAYTRFNAQQEALHQQFFPREQLSPLLDQLFQMRTDLRNYRDWGVSSVAERQLLERAGSRYERLLEQAAGIELTVNLPELPVLIPTGSPGENITLPYTVHGPGTAYLLGADADEVESWRAALAFEEQE